ncbi:hypothetical protein NUW54_g3441 [Trametes sanguinea]|uniref:Uncharacterized protein n=1 Tax=Trametes sanguinea TaxID=158606 RepID=A0ACC1Q0R1_9APHY|nr:hypothetical protein NUW54_g3441 [Trametes sanguinea]
MGESAEILPANSLPRTKGRGGCTWPALYTSTEDCPLPRLLASGKLAVAYEELEGDDHEAEGNGFELIGLLAIFDPPRDDTKQTIDDALALGVKVKMVTGDQLAIAKETGRRLGLGDHMYPAKVLKDGPEPGSRFRNLDEMILDADGFAGVFPEHKYEIVKRLQALGHLCAMTGDGANDAPALSRANVGIAVEGATDAARSAADIVLTEPGLSTIVHAIRGSRIIFQRMRNYAIYACAVTIRIVVCFSILAFAFKFDFPPFMVLIIALLNDGTIMTLSVDRVLPSNHPDSWDLAEIFAFAVAYGLYLTLSTIALVAIAIRTTWFFDKFGVTLHNGAHQALDHNDPQLHMIVYLQVAIISQALIFVTRSHGFFFMERPSVALFCAFCLAQLVSSIIAAYGNWGFTNIEAVSGGWIGIVWIWDIVWFIPLDWIKFAMKATVIKYLRARHAAASPRHPRRQRISHFVMNLPDTAILFLDAFRGVLAPDNAGGRDLSGLYDEASMPMVHCHCFTRELEPEKAETDIRQRVEEKLGHAVGEETSFHWVRSVAPQKEMYCDELLLYTQGIQSYVCTSAWQGNICRPLQYMSGRWLQTGIPRHRDIAPTDQSASAATSPYNSPSSPSPCLLPSPNSAQPRNIVPPSLSHLCLPFASLPLAFRRCLLVITSSSPLSAHSTPRHSTSTLEPHLYTRTSLAHLAVLLSLAFCPPPAFSNRYLLSRRRKHHPSFRDSNSRPGNKVRVSNTMLLPSSLDDSPAHHGADVLYVCLCPQPLVNEVFLTPASLNDSLLVIVL